MAEEARGSDPFAIAASEREELRQLRKENAELRTEPLAQEARLPVFGHAGGA